ncbi:hypothetical protein D3C81_2194910 [compost metagenome]
MLGDGKTQIDFAFHQLKTQRLQSIQPVGAPCRNFGLYPLPRRKIRRRECRSVVAKAHYRRGETKKLALPG